MLKKIISLALCVGLMLTGVLPALAAPASGAVCAASASSQGSTPGNAALLFLEDTLFLMTQRLRDLLRTLLRCPDLPEETAFPKALVQAKTLLLLDRPEGDAALVLGSLQGVLANASETQLLFRDGSYRAYLEDTGAELEERAGESAQPAYLLREFAPYIKGYVLCDAAGAQAAVSVAGVLQAVVIPESLLAAAQAAGLPMLEDARGWTDRTLRCSRYFGQLNRKVAFSQPVAYAPKLVDYAVMSGAYFGFSDSEKERDCRSMYAFLADNAVVFGWNPVLGEYGTVAALSRLNACLIPADHACNLSVLSGFPAVDLKQRVFSDAPAESAQETSADAPRHTVCLFMSDGDNLQWILTGFNTASHFASPVRGQFPMGWGVPASLSTCAPTMGSYLYRSATVQDEFILQISGLGYTFSSRWTNPFALRHMYGALSQQMAQAELHVAAVLDDGGFAHRSLDVLAGQESVSAVFYLDYADYAGTRGAVRLSHGKPIVGAKYKLWADLPGSSPEEIAAAVNAASGDPADPEAYSLIVIHAWSGLDAEGRFVGYGDTMGAVQQLVAAFDDHVRLVTPSVFAAELTEVLTASAPGC